MTKPKRFLFLIVFFCLVFVSNGCGTPQSPNSASSVLSSEIEGTGSKPQSVPYTQNQITIAPDVSLTFLQSDSTTLFSQASSETTTMCNLYKKGGYLYYISCNQNIYYANRMNMETEQVDILYSTKTEILDEFLVLEDENLLLAFQSLDTSEQFSQKRLFHYNIEEKTLSSAEEKYGIAEAYVSYAAESNGFLYFNVFASVNSPHVFYKVTNGQSEKLDIPELIYSSDFSVDGETFYFKNNGGVFVVNAQTLLPQAILALDSPPGTYATIKFFGDVLIVSINMDNPNKDNIVAMIDLTRQELIKSTSYSRFSSVAATPGSYSIMVCEIDNMENLGTILSAQVFEYDWDGSLINTYPPFEYPAQMVANYYVINKDIIYYLESPSSSNRIILRAAESL